LQTEDLVEAVRQAADGKKAVSPVTLAVGALTTAADFFFICGGENDRHVRAIVDGILSQARSAGVRPLHVEGADRAIWVLIDYGALVVHVFQSAARDYYRLERLWSTEATAAAARGAR
jgi:ribosome-associated protein